MSDDDRIRDLEQKVEDLRCSSGYLWVLLVFFAFLLVWKVAVG
jgi:hypothetical protein